MAPDPSRLEAGVGFTCFASVPDSAFSCDWTGKPTLTTGPLQNVIVGGQGTYVNLIGDNVVWDPGQREWSVDIQIENLTGQPFATLDGDNPEADGTRIFIFRGPTGGLTLLNPSGAGTFTAPGQPYIQYDGIIERGGGLSDEETWTFSVPVGVETFSFSVYLHTIIPAPWRDPLDHWEESRAPDMIENFSTYGDIDDLQGNIMYMSWDNGPDSHIDRSFGYGPSNRSLRYDFPAGEGTDYRISYMVGGAPLYEVWIEAWIKFEEGFDLGMGAYEILTVEPWESIPPMPDDGYLLMYGGGEFRAFGPSDDGFMDSLITTDGEYPPEDVFNGEWIRIRWHVLANGGGNYHALWINDDFIGDATFNSRVYRLNGIRLGRDLWLQPATDQSLWWGGLFIWALGGPGW